MTSVTSNIMQTVSCHFMITFLNININKHPCKYLMRFVGRYEILKITQLFKLQAMKVYRRVSCDKH